VRDNSDSVKQSSPSERIAKTSTLRRRPPRLGPGPRDIRSRLGRRPPQEPLPQPFTDRAKPTVAPSGEKITSGRERRVETMILAAITGAREAHLCHGGRSRCGGVLAAISGLHGAVRTPFPRPVQHESRALSLEAELSPRRVKHPYSSGSHWRLDALSSSGGKTEEGGPVFESRRRQDSNTRPSNINKNNLVAPTGFEPVFTVRHALAVSHQEVRRC
jgi:hypothetical protein